MTEKKEQSYGACKKAPGHSDHMCILMEKGLTEEIRRRSLRPAYFCGSCEAQADEAQDLCDPEPL
jgi:hypothetical protein